MALYHKKQIVNGQSMQQIPNIEGKQRLQKMIMELMQERMKAREERLKLNEQKSMLRSKLVMNAKQNHQLDTRIDKLMEQWIK